MPLILLDDVGAGGVGGDLDTRGFAIGMEAIALPILNLGLFFALNLPDLRRVSSLFDNTVGWSAHFYSCMNFKVNRTAHRSGIDVYN